MNDFLARLRAFGKVKVTDAEAARAYREAHPEFADDGEFPKRFVDALSELAEGGFLRLPARRHWDHSVRPPTPRTVSLGNRQPRAPRDAVAWVPILAFGSETRHAVQLKDLVAVNSWLAKRDTARRPTVPAEERSLEIFGDEKRLGRISDANGTLFGGRLRLSDLDCTFVDTPICHQRGPRPGPILVVENAATYNSFCRRNAEPESGHPFGAIAFGSGGAFRSSWRNLAEVSATVGGGPVLYLGDVDRGGIAILEGAAREARSRGMDLRPHVGFYRWLLTHGSRRPRETAPGRPARPTAVPEWLFPRELAKEIAAVLESGLRIPQEALGYEALSAFTKDALLSG